MTGLVTSTISPAATAIHGGPRSAFSPAERLDQTVGTVRSLLALGIPEIYVLDNSPDLDTEAASRTLEPAEVVRCPPTRYLNKGISEAHMVLSFCDSLALTGPLLKVSGRYQVGQLPPLDWAQCDIAAVADERNISTQCYAVRDSGVLERLMTGALREIYGYSSRIVGLRSAWRILHHSLFPERDDYPHHDPTFSLEFGCRRAIRRERMRLCAVEGFDVRGVIGGGEFAGAVVARPTS